MLPDRSLRDQFLESQMFALRCAVAGVVIAGMVIVLVMRMVTLQVFEHEQYAMRADKNRTRIQVVPPARGIILDRNGVQLAANLPTFTLVVIPDKIKGKDRGIDQLMKELGQVVALRSADIQRFKKRRYRESKYSAIPLRTNLSQDELARFELFRQNFPGVFVESGLLRRYPLGAYGAHTIGYVGAVNDDDLKRLDKNLYRGTTHVGKVGIERQYEDILHGTPGSKMVETDANGRALRQLASKNGVPGTTLHLALDARLQYEIFQAMTGHEGSVVAVDPRNGEVLALVSKPGFDPHLFIDGIDSATYKALNEDPIRPLYNRALQAAYPPGSTIKPMMALGGLQYRLFGPGDRRGCRGYYTLPGSSRQFRDWKRSGHGSVDMALALMQSCDIYFYSLANEMGIDRIGEFTSQFGLGRKSNIDMPNEKPGILPSQAWKKKRFKDRWYPGETLNTGIGQGYMLMTPIQIAQMGAHIAGRGTAYQPHLLRATEDPNSRQIKLFNPVLDNVVTLDNANYWEDVIKAMVGTAHDGRGTTHKMGAGAGYNMAVKTGTAQVVGIRQGERARHFSAIEKRFRDHALMVAFAPAEKPVIALGIILEHGGSGGSVAAPVVRKILDAWMKPETTTVPAEAFLPPPKVVLDTSELPPASTPAVAATNPQTTPPRVAPTVTSAMPTRINPAFELDESTLPMPPGPSTPVDAGNAAAPVSESSAAAAISAANNARLGNEAMTAPAQPPATSLPKKPAAEAKKPPVIPPKPVRQALPVKKPAAEAKKPPVIPPKPVRPVPPVKKPATEAKKSPVIPPKPVRQALPVKKPAAEAKKPPVIPPKPVRPAPPAQVTVPEAKKPSVVSPKPAPQESPSPPPQPASPLREEQRITPAIDSTEL